MSKIKDELKEIKSLHQKVKETYKKILNDVGPSYELAGKLLAEKTASEVKKELQKYAESRITYDRDLKGRSWRCIRVYMSNWQEYKDFRKYIDNDAFGKNMRDAIYNVLHRYGFGDLPYEIEESHSDFSSSNYTFRLDLEHFDYPDSPGTPGFFEKLYNKNK